MTHGNFANRYRQTGRGLSLVELMVGIAIGLFIVASASLVVSTQLSDNRRLLLEVQVQQDLRATAEIITREIRRAGGRDGAAIGVWQGGVGVTANPFDIITITEAGKVVRFDYERGTNLLQLGFKLDPTRPVIQSFIGTVWQDLTDGNTLRVTSFTVERAPSPPPPPLPAADPNIIPCAKACPAGAHNSCWPRFEARSYIINISGQAMSDSRVQRSVRSEVRVRNDRITFDASLPAGQACPI